MSKWFVYNKKNNYDKLKKYRELSKIQRLILANRDVVDDKKVKSFIDSDLTNMYDPFLLKDMDKAVDKMFDYMSNDGKILIVGDYDADGVTSTTILYKGLSCYYDKIDYYIPDRINDGYGLNISIVDHAIEDGVNLIITCDNGIAAFEAVEYAMDKGICVIVTDHHQLAKEDGQELIPRAYAVINPSQKACNYPLKGICGALVAYKFVMAFFMRYGIELGVEKDYILDLLQFAAIGTICDVMDLTDENRIVVIEGLKRLNQTKNPGLLELFKQLNLNERINVYSIGFIIGPTINATGRLFTAKLAVELFVDNDSRNLPEYVRELIALNQDRRKITLEALEEAVNLIKKDRLEERDIIIVYMEDVHESICGLVAGRLKEIYHKPTLVFTDAYKDDSHLLKGSGRSIEAYDMHKELSRFKDHYVAFGGHKMACGLTINYDDFEFIASLINENSPLEKGDFSKIINIDSGLDFRVISLDLIKEIEKLEPFGKGFEKPKFASKNVIINNIAILGKNKNLMKISLSQAGVSLDAINFQPDLYLNFFAKKFNIRDIERNLDKMVNKSIDIVYNLQINTFRNNEQIQLILEEIR